MIQRIQSVYLFLTTFLSFLFPGGKMLKFTDASGNLLGVTFRGIYRYGAGSPPELLGGILPLLSLILLIAVFSLISIFFFRNRKLQMKLTAILLGLSAVVIIVTVVYAVLIMRKYDSDIIWSFRMFLPLLIPVCLFFAYRGIKKDDDLVESYDRLR
ncbi:MAG: DUF4293 domain-containing protein [Bacteroidota bacterium]